MILFDLKCDKNHVFEAWFASSSQYEKQQKKNLINCPVCNSNKIKKSLMSPSIINNKSKNNNLNSKKFSEVRKKLKQYKKFIKNNFDYVGDNFSYEARSVHYNHKKRRKGIYGKASASEIKELSEEGIETEIIPWINDSEN